MNNKKRILKIVIYFAILALALGGGVWGGLFESMGQALNDIHINGLVLLKLVAMVCIVSILQNICLMILNLFHFNSNRSNTVKTILGSVIQYAAILIIICWALTILGVNVETVVASVGVFALIIGFGAESLIADVITGFFMLFENQYNVGDIVEVDGFRGFVTNIGIRTTALTDVGGNVKIINNSNMKDILNRSNKVSKAVSEIGIPYETDLEKFEEQIPAILESIYKSHEDKMKSVPEYLGVSQLADSSVVLKFCVEVDEADIYSVQRVLNRELFVQFKKAGVCVPFPQVDVHMQ